MNEINVNYGICNGPFFQDLILAVILVIYMYKIECHKVTNFMREIEIHLCELCESSADCINFYHKFFIVPCTTMHKTLECINKNRINLSRGPVCWIHINLSCT